MDTSDPDIAFDEWGVCNHCRKYEELLRARVPLSAADKERELAQLVDRIKLGGANRNYDCIIGVSGGVDSTYLAYVVKQLGLRPLAVHLDNGWNSELAASNIHTALKKLGIDLFTYVIDWEEFRDLQLSFLKASTPDGEIPTDHAIGAVLFQAARKHRVRYIISGHNVATEALLPAAWSQGHSDYRYIRSVHSKFGSVPLKTFPHFPLLGLHYHFLKTYEVVYLLNYVDFNKEKVTKFLETELGWRNYGGKHYESIYTRFYQGYLLPTKFGFDKRRAHLSNLVCSGQLSRDSALEELKKSPYPNPRLLEEDLEFVPKKLGLSRDGFELIMKLPPKTYWNYPNYLNSPAYKFLKAAWQPVKRLRKAMTS